MKVWIFIIWFFTVQVNMLLELGGITVNLVLAYFPIITIFGM